MRDASLAAALSIFLASGKLVLCFVLCVMGNCVKSPLRNLSQKMHQEERSCLRPAQTGEEGAQGPLMLLAQNCAVMHNLLGPACIFLRKGFAENRQPVREF